MDDWANWVSQKIEELPAVERKGRVIQIIGLVIECTGPTASIGEMCLILEYSRDTGKMEQVGEAEVVGFREGRTLLMPLGNVSGIRPGMAVSATGKPLEVSVGNELLGRVLDGLGRPMDGLGPLPTHTKRSIYADPPNALLRSRIHEPMWTGVRAIDGFLTMGKGQRMGIFAGSGVGKSVTLGMIARNCLAQVNVIALIGERGREVREFIEKDLGPEGMARSVVVIATSDQPALVRLKASQTATTIAEYFRDQGLDVLLMLDSSTRLALAQREIGLAVGEPPATKGYTPSVFAFLPKLFERAGNSDVGTITAIYTVLVEGDDMDDPIADTVRGILDGHIVLDRNLANKNHYPAIAVLKSISRCRTDIVPKDQTPIIGDVLRSWATYAKSEDLISIGAYVKGSDADIDRAIKRHKAIESFLIQPMDQPSDPAFIQAEMKKIFDIK